jgi:hypothetical protein
MIAIAFPPSRPDAGDPYNCSAMHSEQMNPSGSSVRPARPHNPSHRSQLYRPSGASNAAGTDAVGSATLKRQAFDGAITGFIEPHELTGLRNYCIGSQRCGEPHPW